MLRAGAGGFSARVAVEYNGPVSSATPIAMHRRAEPGRSAQAPRDTGPPPRAATGWERVPGLPIVLTLLLIAMVFVPPVRGHGRLTASFLGVAAGLLVWEAALWAVGRRRGQAFRIEFNPVKSHYVQVCVQFAIMLYWGWYWRNVYAELPLIFAQVVFFYILDGLFSWSRGRVWRLGFGPLPIVVSTNLLLWFKHEWYFLQFLMLATGALGKQFVTWNREGRRTHIFNPSAFGQTLFAIALIATGTTNDLTWGREIAAGFEVPLMLTVIFLGGLVVQYLFHVTLMTVAAAGAIALLNIVYTSVFGTYYFVNTHIPAPVFLGLHLLVTDPATSPRTNAGRVIFGALYGLGYSALFRILDVNEIPTFWDKLLPVCILNLMVPVIDRSARGLLGGLNRAWEGAWSPARLNLAHMACWIGLFLSMRLSGFIEAPHPGDSIPFWKQALAAGKPLAGNSLVMAAGAQAKSDTHPYPPAVNELGVICIEGKLVNKSHGSAAKYFASACALDDLNGCANVAIQYLFLYEKRSDEDVARALGQLEEDCAAAGNWLSCFLVGVAHETGRGRPQDVRRALELFERCGNDNVYACKGRARIALAGINPAYDLKAVAPALARASDGGDAEASWYLAYMLDVGNGAPRDEQTSRLMMQRACRLGSKDACEALRQPSLPAFSRPVMLVPNWQTAFPMP